MRVKEKHKSIDITLAEVNELLPESSFIAFFGTSHTYGNCQRTNGWALDKEDIYPNKLSDMFGLPLMNFSIPGNFNARIQQQVLDFLELDRSKNCEMVIAEVRLADQSYYFSRDVFVDKLVTNGNNPEIVAGSDIWVKSFWTNMFTDYVLGGDANEDYLKERIINMQLKPGYTPIKQEVELLRDIINTNTITRFASVQQFIEDLNTVRTIQRLFRLAGIPFYWFCWDEKTKFLDRSHIQHVEEIYNRNTKIYKNQLLQPNMKSVLCREKGRDFMESNKCECNHLNETVHDWVAYKLFDEINGQY